MKTIDHYRYWWSKEEKKGLLPREKKAIEFIKEVSQKEKKFLDAGCGTGEFLSFIKKKFRFEGFGLDYSRDAVNICKKKNLNVKFADLNSKIPFKKDSLDIVYAGEVIEHLYNPDRFLEEVRKVLKKGGYLILTTPNLCSWYNRILFLLGIQPVFMKQVQKVRWLEQGDLED